MNDLDFLAQAMRYQDGVLTPDELAAFENAMRDDPSKRQLFAETQVRSTVLHDRFRQEAFQSGCGFSRTPEKKRFAWITRPITSWLLGLSLACFARRWPGPSQRPKW
jgi:hypothetical protein